MAIYCQCLDGESLANQTVRRVMGEWSGGGA